MKFFLTVLKIIVAAVFIYAGIVKILHPDDFYKSILAYQILPQSFAFIAAYTLPPFEVLLGISLFYKGLAKPSALILMALTLIFILAILSARLRGFDISCGCFGESSLGAHLNGIVKNITIIIVLYSANSLD